MLLLVLLLTRPLITELELFVGVVPVFWRPLLVRFFPRGAVELVAAVPERAEWEIEPDPELAVAALWLIPKRGGLRHDGAAKYTFLESSGLCDFGSIRGCFCLELFGECFVLAKLPFDGV